MESDASAPANAFELCCRAIADPRTGHVGQGLSAIAELEQSHAQDHAFSIALIHAMHNRHESAMEWLERSYGNNGATGIAAAWNNWFFEPLSDDPGFTELLQRTGVSEEHIRSLGLDTVLPD